MQGYRVSRMSVIKTKRITLFLLFMKAAFLSMGLEHLRGVIHRSSWVSPTRELHFWSLDKHVKII